MNRFHFLLSVCAAVFVYVCLSAMFGQEGIWAYKQLQKQKIVLSRSVERLQDLNGRLFTESTALQKDTDVIAAYAKKMGFIYPGEHLVKISGMPEPPAFVYDPGTKLLRPDIIYIPEWLVKSIAFLVFVFYNLLYSLISLIRYHDPAKI
ncbi:septum formation initiator family protein [Treponema sp. OMZ 840]|uniref:FtsB family cell division protein n=1 Tax=Treponema sp. OMZ 840 TaxID=244313 RepID=UPI003D93EB1D